MFFQILFFLLISPKPPRYCWKVLKNIIFCKITGKNNFLVEIIIFWLYYFGHARSPSTPLPHARPPSAGQSRGHFPKTLWKVGCIAWKVRERVRPAKTCFFVELPICKLKEIEYISSLEKCLPKWFNSEIPHFSRFEMYESRAACGNYRIGLLSLRK